MSNILSREVIFNTIVAEMTLRILSRHMYPDSTMTEAKASALATVDAVKQTWYFYNNQEAFRNNLIFTVKE